jgi:hypothetical protein
VVITSSLTCAGKEIFLPIPYLPYTRYGIANIPCGPCQIKFQRIGSWYADYFNGSFVRILQKLQLSLMEKVEDELKSVFQSTSMYRQHDGKQRLFST